MPHIAGKTIGMIGALAALPRRLAAREVERQGGYLRRGTSRRTSLTVVGRGMLDRYGRQEIERRLDAAGGTNFVSENGFLRLLGLREETETGSLGRQALIEQSGLCGHDLDRLALFDAFIRDGEPFAFRDAILARKFAALIEGGANWQAIARAVHRSGEVDSLTALSLHADGFEKVYARFEETLAELDGQLLLPVDEREPDDTETLFETAESAEAEGQFDEAAMWYGRCLNLDPGDSVAAFNRANCLRAAERPQEAARAYLQALRRDPEFVDAWFNFAGLQKETGNTDAARRHLLKAIELDGDYADAIYNLATLEFDVGALAEARRWWARYLEFDRESDWARNAVRGIQYVDMAQAGEKAG